MGMYAKRAFVHWYVGEGMEEGLRRSRYGLFGRRGRRRRRILKIFNHNNLTRKKIEKLYHDFHLPFFVTLKIIPVHFFFMLSLLILPNFTALPPFLLSFVVTYSKLN